MLLALVFSFLLSVPVFGEDPAAGISLNAPPPPTPVGSLSTVRVPSRPKPSGTLPNHDSLQRMLVVLAAAGLAARPRRRSGAMGVGPGENPAIDEAVGELRWLLDDSLRNDIGSRELSRARAVVEALDSYGPTAIGRLSDAEIETWIRETRGWVGGFSFNEGSDHLRFLAASLRPAQASRFAADLLPYVSGAALRNRLAVYETLARDPAHRVPSGIAVAADADRVRVLNAMAGSGAIQQLMLGVQMRSKELEMLTTGTGLSVAARADVVLGGAGVLAPWQPAQDVPATRGLPGLVGLLDGDVVTQLRRHHSPSSDDLVPLFVHVLAAEGPQLENIFAEVAGSRSTYRDRFNAQDRGHFHLAANMGYLMGVAAEAAYRSAAGKAGTAKTISRLVEVMISVVGAPAGPIVGGGTSIAIKELEDGVSSQIKADGAVIRKHLYYLGLPHEGDIDTVDPGALSAYQNAFAGVRP
ncbi:MAG: hypothetical protein KJN81_02900 [Acidimicrobiia bacterium]|nr:hypothetical protein [Acidimicrobiia bacterium]NNL27357.1 hypothetical protein [Acidimicrobiia bacterium]